jgi:hypothetical protein
VIDVSRIPSRLEDVHHEDVSATTVETDAHEPPPAEDVCSVTARILERFEEPLATATSPNVLAQPSPARDGTPKITIVVDASVARHPPSVAPGYVAELLVEIETTLSVTVPQVVDLPQKAAFPFRE